MNVPIDVVLGVIGGCFGVAALITGNMHFAPWAYAFTAWAWATQPRAEENKVTPELKSILRHLGIVGYEFYSAHIVGNSCPRNATRLARMQQLKMGDLVLELSSTPRWIHYAPRTEWHEPEHCLGFFSREAREPIPNWVEAEEGEPAPTEKVYYIFSLDDGRELRWTNARFITILPVEGWSWL